MSVFMVLLYNIILLHSALTRELNIIGYCIAAVPPDASFPSTF